MRRLEARVEDRDMLRKMFSLSYRTVGESDIGKTKERERVKYNGRHIKHIHHVYVIASPLTCSPTRQLDKDNALLSLFNDADSSSPTEMRSLSICKSMILYLAIPINLCRSTAHFYG